MDSDIGSLWFLVAILTGAIGTGMAVYGIRQRDPLTLAFGVAISAAPMCVSTAWAAALLSIAVGALYFVVRKWR